MTSPAKELIEVLDVPLYNPPELLQRDNQAASVPTSYIHNFFLKKYENRQTGKQEIYLSKRPGYTVKTSSTAPTTAEAATRSQGMFYWDKTNVLYSVQGADLGYFNLTTGAWTSLATDFVPTTGPVAFTEFFTGSAYLLLVKGIQVAVSGKKYQIDTSSVLTEITDADFPTATSIGQFVCMDGYVFTITDDGKIYNSDLGSATAWTSTSFIQCNLEADKGVGLAKYKGQIMAFGRDSIEFFYNTGNATGSPLARNEKDMVSGIGCAAAASIQAVNDTVIWGNFSGIYKLEENKPKKISTTVIDDLLKTLTTPELDIISGTFGLPDNVGYSLTSDKVLYNRTYIYDPVLDYWSIFNTKSSGTVYPFGQIGNFLAPTFCAIAPGLFTTYFPTTVATNKLAFGVFNAPLQSSLDATTLVVLGEYKTRPLDFGTTNPVRIHKINLEYSAYGSATRRKDTFVNFGRFVNKPTLSISTPSNEGNYTISVSGGTSRTGSAIMGELYKIEVSYSICEH